MLYSGKYPEICESLKGLFSAVQWHSNVTLSYAADSRTLCLPMRIHIYTYSYAISALSTATPFLYNSSGAISISPFCQTVTP